MGRLLEPLGEGPDSAGEDDTRRVQITRPFVMMATEFRASDWLAVLDVLDDEHQFPCLADLADERGAANCDNEPSLCVITGFSWLDATCIANAISFSHGLPLCYTRSPCPVEDADCTVAQTPEILNGADCSGFRLPTEAEWEYAARAGTSTPWWGGWDYRQAYEGERIVHDRAGTADNLNIAGALAGRPNPWGLYRIIGSNWEWVEDRFGRSFYSGQRATLSGRPQEQRFDVDPVNSQDPTNRMHGLRGGSIESTADGLELRSAVRHPQLSMGERHEVVLDAAATGVRASNPYGRRSYSFRLVRTVVVDREEP